MEEIVNRYGCAPALAHRRRREFLRWPLGALGSALALKTLSSCAPERDGVQGPSIASDPAPNGASGPEGAETAPRPGGARGAAAACAKPTTFAPIVDDGLRTSATSTDQTDTLDWITMGVSGALYQTTLPDTLLRLLRSLGDVRLGYPLSPLAHSLQTATRARRAGASDDLVLAALLHHVGMALSVEGYAELSAAIVRGHVSDDAYQILRHHPEYACAHYGALTGMPTDERTRYVGQTFHADAVRFADDWERVSYDPAYPTLALEVFEPLLRDRFASLATELYATHGDCVEGSAP